MVTSMLSPWLRGGTSHRCTSESAVDGAEADDDAEVADGAEAADGTKVATEMQSPCVEKVITDIVLDGLEAATTLGKPHGDEEEKFYSVMSEIATLPVNIILHVLASVHFLPKFLLMNSVIATAKMASGDFRGYLCLPKLLFVPRPEEAEVHDV